MSADTADDLHALEDALGSAKDLLKRMAGAVPVVAMKDPTFVALVAEALAMAGEPFCRPTCGYYDAAEDDRAEILATCEANGCGCPCDHDGLLP